MSDPVAPERAWFMNAGRRRQRAEGARRFISAAEAAARTRILAPADADALGLPFGTPWTADLEAQAAAAAATAATAATREAAAASGLDEDDLPPLVDEPEPEPLADPMPDPFEPSPDPRPAPDLADEDPLPPASRAAEPIAEPPPPPADPEPATEGSSGPPTAPPAVPLAALAGLMSAALVNLSGGIMARLGAHKGCEPVPLTDEERAALAEAWEAVLNRYLPWLEVAHPELLNLAATLGMVVIMRRLVLPPGAPLALGPMTGEGEGAGDPDAPAPARRRPAPSDETPAAPPPPRKGPDLSALMGA